MKENSIVVPVSLLLDLYNQANAATRVKMDDHIRDYKTHYDDKGHVAEGFRKSDDGQLIFDQDLYNEAVYRGKVDTYASAARRDIEELRRKLGHSLGLMNSLAQTHNKIATSIPPDHIRDRLGIGKPISDEDMLLLNKLSLLLQHEGGEQ